ncbi:hypothetical protein ACFPER_06970 [Agromyces aurantiacus]|uniref:Uncharacterized protein n=1 Tax=Agromyces aurantiacus TaxID=165814 RepID=A0ABV9R8Q2_9MICO|nr:hypothetical protein [Agromyces aurantiacus]MBM7503206.1 hypothetical protein [Agromyces aurantiacus]
MGELTTDAERWWPRLSIRAKHAILADPAAPLDDAVREEIGTLTDAPAPERLGAADRDYIRTQTEFVD